MKDSELKLLWRKSHLENSIKVDKETLIKELDVKLKENSTSVKRRNLYEIMASIIVVMFFIYTTVVSDSILSKMGGGIIALTGCFVIYKLSAFKSFVINDINKSILEKLKEAKISLEREIKNIKSALFWYIIPFQIGFILYILGFGLSTTSIVLSIVSFSFGFLVYYYNNKSLKQNFEPYLENINKNIKILSE